MCMWVVRILNAKVETDMMKRMYFMRLCHMHRQPRLSLNKICREKFNKMSNPLKYFRDSSQKGLVLVKRNMYQVGRVGRVMRRVTVFALAITVLCRT